MLWFQIFPKLLEKFAEELPLWSLWGLDPAWIWVTWCHMTFFNYHLKLISKVCSILARNLWDVWIILSTKFKSMYRKNSEISTNFNLSGPNFASEFSYTYNEVTSFAKWHHMTWSNVCLPPTYGCYKNILQTIYISCESTLNSKTTLERFESQFDTVCHVFRDYICNGNGSEM